MAGTLCVEHGNGFERHLGGELEFSNFHHVLVDFLPGSELVRHMLPRKQSQEGWLLFNNFAFVVIILDFVGTNDLRF